MMSPFRRSSPLVAALASALLLSLLSPASAQPGSPGSAGDPDPSSVGAAPAIDRESRGQAAIDRLGDRLPDVARAYGLRGHELRRLLLEDSTLAVDGSDELLYIDVLVPGEAAAASSSNTSSGAAAAPPTTGPEFQLASLPGAAKTIYLDFDGHVTVGTTWNSTTFPSIVTSPYSTDGNPDAWSSNELQVIRDTWAVVAEDFAPWNINVTTIEPSIDDLRRSGGGDTRWGARVVFTPDDWSGCGCGGHAYIGAFDDVVDEPTFVYNSSFVGASEAATHEVGHMLGLAHDGLSSGPTYYQGHQAAGQPGWAPIMGVAYYQPVGQWSQQEFFGANNTGSGANYNRGPDDVAIISSLSNGNNFGLRSDDHGGTASPTVLTGPTPSVDGIIETRTDVDAFSFTTTGGSVSFTATGDAVSTNLDIELTLRNGSGAIVAQDNPLGSLGASLSATLPSGTYTVAIDGVGVGNPFLDPPTGYTDYGSLGRYQLTAVIDGVGPPDTDPPAVPTGLDGSESGGDVLLTWSANTDEDLAGYIVRRATTSGGAFTDIASPGSGSTSYTDASALVGDNVYVLAARDASGNVSDDSLEVTINVAPAPSTEVATGENPVYGSVGGNLGATHARGGAVQTITEVQSGGKPSNRHDRAEHRWTVPAALGNQELTVVATATDAGDADDGFVIEWSANGSVWLPVAVVTAANAVDATVSIGGPTGTIQVRVRDTDRSRGQRIFDSVSVDFIQITGDGGSVDPQPATSVITSITVGTQGVGKGRQVGTATVMVTDDRGNPVAGATVSVDFGGSFAETRTGVTNASGVVTVRTLQEIRKPAVAACVSSVTTTVLPWAPGPGDCPVTP